MWEMFVDGIECNEDSWKWFQCCMNILFLLMMFLLVLILLKCFWELIGLLSNYHNNLMLNLFSCVTYAVTAYIQACHNMWPAIELLVHVATSFRVFWHLTALDTHLELLALYRNLIVPIWRLLPSIWLEFQVIISPFCCDNR